MDIEEVADDERSFRRIAQKTGMDAEEIIDRIDGIRCGFKQTSCPDQFAEALREALEKKNSK